jgi:hypothetical protein
MKIKTSCWGLVGVLLLGMASYCWADDDARIITRLGENSAKDHLRVASIYLSCKDKKIEGLPGVPTGNTTRFYSKIWDGLYLQVTTEPGEDGPDGYLFSFSTDEAGVDVVKINESRDAPSMLEMTAADFRSDDNFTARPLQPGPGTPLDRSAWRVIHYDGFDVDIRVLEFNIDNIQLKQKPYFKSVSCLVTVKEMSAKK